MKMSVREQIVEVMDSELNCVETRAIDVIHTCNVIVKILDEVFSDLEYISPKQAQRIKDASVEIEYEVVNELEKIIDSIR